MIENFLNNGFIILDLVDKNRHDLFSSIIKNKIISTIPVGRLGEADEIAKLAVYLAADESSYITGSTISINGGQYFS